MAELGLIATIAGLATTAYQVWKKIDDLVRTYKDTPGAIVELCETVSTLNQVLEQIQKRHSATPAEGYLKDTLGTGTYIKAAKNCKQDLLRLELILLKLSKGSSNAFWLHVKNTAKWIYLEDHIEAVTEALEKHKSLFSLLLSLDLEKQISQVSDVKEDTGRIRQLVEVVADRVDKAQQLSQSSLKIAEDKLTEPPSKTRGTSVDDQIVILQQAVKATTIGSDAKAPPRSPHLVTPIPSDKNQKAKYDEMNAQKETETVNEVTRPSNKAPIHRIQTPELVSALCTAAVYGFTDTVSLLIRTGIDINAYDGNSTALWQAIDSYFNDRTVGDTVTLLLDHGADPNLSRKKGNSPLVQACCRGRGLEVVRVLIAKGANVKEPGLLNKGSIGMSPEILEHLIDAGADVNSFHHGKSVLYTAIDWERRDQRELVEILLKKGADPTLQGKANYSPVTHASAKGQADIVQLLLEYGNRSGS